MKKILYAVISAISWSVYLCRLTTRDTKQDRITVLAYHGIASQNKKGERNEWIVNPKMFKAQMEYLKRNNYVVLTIDEIINHIKNGMTFPPKAVCITFDDGYRNNYTQAFHILKIRGFKATFYVVTGFIDSSSPFPWIKIPKNYDQSSTSSNNYATDTERYIPLTWDQVSEMAKDGMVFASHSNSHPNFANIDENELVKEITVADHLLSKHLKYYSKTFVCPFGIHPFLASKLTNHLKALNFFGAFLGKWGSVRLDDDLFNLPRLSVYGNDSLAIFKLKVQGHYDWLRYLYSLWKRIWYK